MFDSISNFIGSGTGVNSRQLIADLLAASREPKEAVLRSREQANSLKISALASASSSLDTFATALSDLLDGRAFAGNLVSSNPSLATVNFIDGARPQGLPATLEITQLASSRRLASGVVADGNVSLGAGTMTINTGSGNFNVTLVNGADSLNDLAKAINESGSGVSASIVTDASGARLVLEGEEGAGNNFTVTGDFADYNYPAGGGGMNLISDAADALVKIDGIDLRFGSNSIENAIAGVAINLNAAAPGTQITISGDQPTKTISALVGEFVDAYNQLRTALNGATAPGGEDGSAGPLSGDSGVREMVRALSQIGATALVDNGPYRALSDIGVKTNRDGTLSIDKDRLDKVLAANPEAVSNMLDPLTADSNNPGIAGVLQSIRDRLQGDDGALEASQNRLEQIKENLLEARNKLDEDSAQYETQLRRTFANMDRQLAVLQATQSYLTQQIAVWNGDND
ncbi:flagellar filament capping protein FliD [Parasphingorhabdus cellanae]|uniref:Flagellar hook-associated protein 2 n=1 Tax=Parasphingorhabdus cellanae TaxID=2806553 RepID=A0ABX7T4G5_9SPHN|nr:flagellar filament capping protein FliD [Parasphingorhabdus cellanae]QTD56470.1 flagellar filament capping protein FliD [Parasphingorhabdus cellanae]